MITPDLSGMGLRRKKAASGPGGGQPSLEHYLRLILYRKWLVLGAFVLVSGATFVVSYRLPNTYTADTLILVDPQKVPDTYVKPTVTGDIRNRLGTLSQQILSATRLQKIIETFNLYPQERKKLPREDVINRMRSDISVRLVSDFGGGQDLQAFRITYSGREPRLVAEVTNELASLFIDENLKAREQQATGTTEFLANQLRETRKALEAQEAKLKDFRLKHVGEMPEQEAADLQILGQLQSQMQLEGDALSRAEQQKSYLQSMMVQAAPVVDLDSVELPGAAVAGGKEATAPASALANDKAKLAYLLSHYTEKHPDVQKLKKQIEDEDAREAKEAKPNATATAAPAPPAPPVAERALAPAPVPVNYTNPVLRSQLTAIDAEIAKHKEEQQRLSKLIGKYQAKLEAIPVRQQEITELVRDYEISKAHYGQLLEKQLSAETATQLEIRQKGEKFSILDPAQVPEKPSRPNRKLINAAGSLGGLGLGLALALMTEFLGMSITGPEQISSASGLEVLEVIPVIRTQADQARLKRRILWATASGVVVTMLASGAILLYHYRGQIF